MIYCSVRQLIFYNQKRCLLHFYDDKIDDVAVSYLVSEIIIQVGFFPRT